MLQINIMIQLFNASSSSMTDDIPPIPDSAYGFKTACYDLYYKAGMTSFYTMH